MGCDRSWTQDAMVVKAVDDTQTGFCQTVVFIGFMFSDVDMKAGILRVFLTGALQCPFRKSQTGV
jgi:hypothetical protein